MDCLGIRNAGELWPAWWWWVVVKRGGRGGAALAYMGEGEPKFGNEAEVAVDQRVDRVDQNCRLGRFVREEVAARRGSEWG